jgi:hypothetical protein
MPVMRWLIKFSETTRMIQKATNVRGNASASMRSNSELLETNSGVKAVLGAKAFLK